MFHSSRYCFAERLNSGIRRLMNAHVFQSLLTVREATKADIAALVDLMQEFYEESSLALDREWAAASFHRLLSSPEQGKIWIALADQLPIGHAVLSLRFTMEHGGLSGYIDDLFVKAAFRRRGCGRLLLSQLRQYCKRIGCKTLQVEVGTTNSEALALYDHFGLRVARDGRVLASGPLGEDAT
ncbi:MAG: GNAT family N-acetyltransferase [Thermostichus sp. BF3_bins_97]